MSPAGETLWQYDFEKPLLNNDISPIVSLEVRLAANGDILLMGYEDRKLRLGGGNDIFLMRIAPDGDILWRHTYGSFVEGSDSLHHEYFPLDVFEFADETILVAGVATHHDQIVMLRVDADGCLEGYNCDEQIILSNDNSGQLTESRYPNFYPSPTDGMVSIDLENVAGSYSVLDICGRLIERQDFISNSVMSIDLGLYKEGLYFVVFETDAGHFVRKVFKR